VREFHAGAQRDVPEVQYVREYDGVFVKRLNDLRFQFVATGSPIGRWLAWRLEKLSKLTSVLLGGKQLGRAGFMFVSSPL
jgi:hypothetical protein